MCGWSGESGGDMAIRKSSIEKQPFLEVILAPKNFPGIPCPAHLVRLPRNSSRIVFAKSSRSRCMMASRLRPT